MMVDRDGLKETITRIIEHENTYRERNRKEGKESVKEVVSTIMIFVEIYTDDNFIKKIKE